MVEKLKISSYTDLIFFLNYVILQTVKVSAAILTDLNFLPYQTASTIFKPFSVTPFFILIRNDLNCSIFNFALWIYFNDSLSLMKFSGIYHTLLFPSTKNAPFSWSWKSFHLFHQVIHHYCWFDLLFILNIRLTHLSLVWPGSLANNKHITSGVTRWFHCADYIMLSHFRKW